MIKIQTRRPEFFRHLYLQKGLSAAQIGKQIGASKTWVLKRLHGQKIRLREDDLKNPQNYRYYAPPYGFAKREGKLIPNRAELRACHLIVNLHSEKNLSFEKIAKELEQRGVRNRLGQVSWRYVTVRKLFLRWKGKI